jgi:hypothetical protein
LHSALTTEVSFPHHAVHGADRTQIHATLKQAVKDLHGWLITVLLMGQNLLNLSALF